MAKSRETLVSEKEIELDNLLARRHLFSYLVTNATENNKRKHALLLYLTDT